MYSERMIFRRILAMSGLTLGLIFIPVRVSAQSNQQLSPPQQNPQTNVSGNLQPTGSGLQNGATNTSQNTADLSQGLLNSSNQQPLRVLGTNAPAVNVQGVSTTNTTSATVTQTSATKTSFNIMWVIVLVLGLGFMAVTYWKFSSPKKRYL